MAGLSPFTVMTNILSLAGLGVWAIFGFWVIGFWVIFKKMFKHQVQGFYQRVDSKKSVKFIAQIL